MIDSLSSVCCACFCRDVMTRQDSCSLLLNLPKALITNAQAVTHKRTVAHMHTCCCSSWLSFITRSLSCETLLIGDSPVIPHICRPCVATHRTTCLTWCATFAPLFVSQNNIRSPMFFQHLHPPHSTHSPLDSNRRRAETETFDPMTLDFKEMYRHLCYTSCWHCVPHDDTDTTLWKLCNRFSCFWFLPWF